MHPTDAPPPDQVSPEKLSDTHETRSVSRAWVIVGVLAVLSGAVMGLIMSSLGK